MSARRLQLPLLCCALLVSGRAKAQELSFSRDVLPILSDRCFACHGPDGRARKADLRLDLEDAVREDRGGYAVVVAGRPDDSELIARITSRDPDEVMPPPDKNLTLTAREVETLRRWVEQGAPWGRHWAFELPVRPAPPELDAAAGNAGWARSPIDRFVAARLQAEGLAPAPEADPAKLLRRLTLDLTGLPPTPEAIDAFVADPSRAAYEGAVDRLLASSRYGERMAWEWLEAARYADTDGYQQDPTRQMWPWRDWLVEALNRNLPFDQLTVEMLAGDLLPDATAEQVLASAFNRNHPYNGEGGRIPEETRVENAFDRLETTATVWLGLTVGCARCHDHKYDPISQVEYYGLYDFFNQTSESGKEGRGAAPPVLRYLGGEDGARAAAIESEVAALELRRESPDAALDARQVRWQADVLQSLRTEPAHSVPVTFGPWYRTDVLAAPAGGVRQAFDHAYWPEAELDLEARAADGTGLWRPDEALVDGTPSALPREVGATYLARDLLAPTDRTLVLSLGSDDAIRAWFDGREVLARDVARGVAPDQERIELRVAPGEHRLLFKVVNIGGAAGFYFRVAEERVFGLTRALVAALERPAAARSDEVRRGLTRVFRSRHASWWADGEVRLRALRAELGGLRDAAPQVMVMDQLPEQRRRATRILERGAYDQPRAAVAPHTPAFLPPLPAAARDRLTLARWLVAAENPLTARVAVNRAWQTFFGRGLVATPEDFGRQGQAPSHPALLDWLATEFIASGQDVKALHRSIVTSATYRQSAAVAAARYLADPDNVLLARGPRFRMPSFMLRDQALALGGLLVGRLGGPPVRPYQPDGVWAEATFDKIRYQRDAGDALYRRSLYVFWRRIVGPTFLFDTAPRLTCVVGPYRTDTPLHALTTLNDIAYVEAARGFAERACRAGGADSAMRIGWAFRAATARVANAAELRRLVDRWQASRAHFARRPEALAAFLSVGEAAPDPSLPADELAAYTVVASILLNLDEVLTR